MADACKEYGLKFWGLSFPRDRNRADYGSPEYITCFWNQLTELLTYYDWPNTYKLVHKLQPDIAIWNDGGDRADRRGVGSEAGFVGKSNWSLLNGKGEMEWGMLYFGLKNDRSWVPAEVNTSIRPEWPQGYVCHEPDRQHHGGSAECSRECGADLHGVGFAVTNPGIRYLPSKFRPRDEGALFPVHDTVSCSIVLKPLD